MRLADLETMSGSLPPAARRRDSLPENAILHMWYDDFVKRVLSCFGLRRIVSRLALAGAGGHAYDCEGAVVLLIFVDDARAS